MSLRRGRERLIAPVACRALPPFRPRPERELVALEDDALLAHLVAARADGHTDQARLALHLLVFGLWDVVAAKVDLKVPPAWVEEVTSAVVESAMEGVFDGSSRGQLRAWITTITKYRIADFYRRVERSLDTVSLHQGSGDDEHLLEPADPAGDVPVHVTIAIEETRAALREDHRRLVDLCVFDGFSAAEACVKVDGMTPDNAYQIARRFRLDLRGRLGA